MIHTPPERAGMAKAIKLRPLREADAQAIHRYAGDERVASTTNTPWPYPEDGGRQFVTNRIAAHSAGRSYSFAILYDDDLIGVVDINAVNREERWAHCDYAIASTHWNKGITTEAVGLAIRIAFTELDLEWLRSECMVRNPASARVLDKNGFVEVGQFLYSSKKFTDEPARRFELQKSDWISAIESHSDR